MTGRISKAQLRALRWLRDNGGHATPDRYGRMVTPDGKVCSQTPATWVRLVCMGHCARSPLSGYLGITAAGLDAAR